MATVPSETLTAPSGIDDPSRAPSLATRPRPWTAVLAAVAALAALTAAGAAWLLPAVELERGAHRLAAQGAMLMASASAGALQPVPALRAQLTALWAELDALDEARQALGPARQAWQAALARLDAGDAGTSVQPLQQMVDAATAAAPGLRAIDQRQRATRLALLTAAALIGSASAGALGLNMRRRRRALRSVLRQASDDLGSGAWQDAVRSLRDDRLGAPSAFDALASGVENTIGTSERRWQTLADLAADWYWETDTGHRLSWISGDAALLTGAGVRGEDLLGTRYDQVAVFEASTTAWARLHAQFEAGRPFRNMEFRLRRGGSHTGPSQWVSISGRPRNDAQGRFLGFEGVAIDVTERKRTLERLRASDQRWVLMTALASDYYFETDAEHRMQPLLPEVARRFGALAEHGEGRTPWEAFPDAMGAQAWNDFRADLDVRRPYHGVELDIDTVDGRRRIVSISGIPRFDDNGGFLGYHGIGSDITMRREAERLLMRHNETLQRAVAERTQNLQLINRDLEAFSRELAHELRTPIGHVQGLAHLLVTKAGDRLSSEEMQLLGLQLQAARHMRETVDALLMLARSTVQPLSFEDVDVSALAQEVVSDLAPAAPARPVRWVIDDGLIAYAAAPALRIVLANLLGNAQKFTQRCPEPEVCLRGHVDGEGWLCVQIVDNGAGFDDAQARRLFKPFGRLHAEQDYQGTGIGLTIVQRIVERHGGRVGAQGRIGQGATFTFTLPRTAQQARLPD